MPEIISTFATRERALNAGVCATFDVYEWPSDTIMFGVCCERASEEVRQITYMWCGNIMLAFNITAYEEWRARGVRLQTRTP